MDHVIPFIAYEISGVKQPIYSSGAANKQYVDDQISATDTPSSWTTVAAGTGVSTFEGSIGVSGSTPVTVNVAGYSTISSQAETAYQWYTESSQKISEQLANIAGSGVEYSAAYQWYTESSQKLSVAYTERGSQIAGDGLFWDGTELDVGGYTTISSQAKTA